MKLKLLTAAALVAFTVTASAATFAVNNVFTGTSASDALFQNEDGTLVNGGIVAMGYFPADHVFSTTDMTVNINAFTSFASALVGSPSASLEGSFAGYVEGPTVQGPLLTGNNALIGRALYVFAGNAATLGGSTEWAIKQIATLAGDEPLEQSYLANPLGGVAPVFGNAGTFTGSPTGGAAETFTTLQLRAVPEPSAALLGAVGALGLLRRRRN